MTELERPGGVKPAIAPKRERRWLWVVVGIFAVAAKAVALGPLLAHRTDLIVATVLHTRQDRRLGRDPAGR